MLISINKTIIFIGQKDGNNMNNRDNKIEDRNMLENDNQDNSNNDQKNTNVKKKKSKYRNLTAFWVKVVAIISISYVFYHLYTTAFGMPMAYKHRLVHLTFVLVLIFILFPSHKGASKTRPTIIDLLLIISAVGFMLYMYPGIDNIALRMGRAVQMDYIIGFIIFVLVVEACRRVLGYQLLIVAIILLLYAYFGRYIPGELSHQGYSIKRLIYQFSLTTQGIFGVPLGISAKYMVLFVFLGSILSQTGMGEIFNNISMGLAGRSPGGPAKVAVLSSGMMGMINGSGAANVAVTGSVTIPLMKRCGFRSYYAAAIEAAASTGGQVMPPIMGSVVFLMAEYIGIPYIKIAQAAFIPAILYFASVYFTIDFRAKKAAVEGLSKSEIPDYLSTIKEKGHMVLPIILLVYLLMMQRTPMYSAFYALLTTLVLAFIRPSTRMSFQATYKAIINAARSTLGVAIAMAVAGIVVGVMGITSLGVVVANNIMVLTGGIRFLILIMTMLICIILGMGLPTTACYVIAVSIAAPILRKLGINDLSAHMFILYFAVFSTVTPPVALSSYVAAGIANANLNRVGWCALRLAAVGFIIPYFFIYSPAILLITDTKFVILTSIITGLISVYFVAGASEGYFLGKRLKWYSSVILFAAAVMLLNSTIKTDIMGFGLAIIAFIIIKFSKY